MRKLLLALVFFLAISGCGPSSTATPNSGIEGHVTIGPTCPVQRIDNPCPDKAYQATLTVLTPERKKVLQFQTDADGVFQVALEPGEYILHPESPNVMPHAQEQPFTVEVGKFTTVDVVYDSGIR